MTTVLCDVRNGLLAVDSFRAADGMLFTSVVKGVRLPDGSLIAWAGNIEQGMLWAHWMQALPLSVHDQAKGQLLDDFTGLHLTTTGQLYRYESLCMPYPIDEPFYAIGNGSDWAMAAMACGKDIVDAMRLACLYSPYTCLPIRVYSLKDVDPVVYKD